MTRQLSGLCLACMLALATGGCPDGLVGGNPTVTLTVDETSIDAAGGVATVTAALDGMSMQPVEVALEFGGTAVSGVSYTRSAMRIVIPSYATSGSITIRGASGTAFNPDAVVTVSIASVTGGTATAGQEPLSIAIISDAAQPTVSLSLPKETTGEVVKEITEFDKNGGTIDVTATLSNLTAQEVTVTLAFAGSAKNEVDYTRSAETIVIAPGKKAGKITLTGVKQEAFVNHKSVIVSIESATNVDWPASTGIKQVTAYIKDTDETKVPKGTLAFDNATDKITISSAGGVATLICTLDEAIASDATIEFTLDSSKTDAKYDEDFIISNKKDDGDDDSDNDVWVLTVPADQKTGSLTITSIQNTQYQGDLRVVLNAGAVTNLTPQGPGSFTVTIQDTVAVPKVTLSVSGSPISEDGGVATVVATQSKTSSVTTTVNLSFSGAVNNTDFVALTTAIEIEPGQLTGSATITGKANSGYTGDKTLSVKIGSVVNGQSDGVQQGTVVITDAQTQPAVTLSLSNPLLYETGGTAAIKAKLPYTSYQKVTVSLAFAGTAQKDTDYTAASSIEIPAGDLESEIAITAVSTPGNRVGTTAIISIGSVTNGTKGDPHEVTATLTDVSVSLSLTGSVVAQDDGVATLTATLSKATTSDVTLQFAFSGSATIDTDYTASDTKIVIPAGQTTGTLTLTTKDTTAYAGDEDITIMTQSSQNAAVVGTNQFKVIKTLQWLADNAQQPDVHVTASGLQYKILTAGPDPDDKPTLSDNVTTNYVGALIDGTQFDSDSGARFGVGEVIDGWTEALQLMSVGSRWMLYIPSNLAYGTGGQGSIPPNSVLIFDVTLVSIP